MDFDSGLYALDSFGNAALIQVVHSSNQVVSENSLCACGVAQIILQCKLMVVQHCMHLSSSTMASSSMRI